MLSEPSIPVANERRTERHFEPSQALAELSVGTRCEQIWKS